MAFLFCALKDIPHDKEMLMVSGFASCTKGSPLPLLYVPSQTRANVFFQAKVELVFVFTFVHAQIKSEGVGGREKSKRTLCRF